jgi:hypothetical protein
MAAACANFAVDIQVNIVRAALEVSYTATEALLLQEIEGVEIDYPEP